MLTPKDVRQPKRRAGTYRRNGRKSTSDNATRVPTSKKCKLDIKRKHLRAVIPGCLTSNSYPINLQIQIDGVKVPGLYRATIKRHVNSKTNCVNYRLQGTGIYEHLRGLYMRGFCCGEEPGVMVLVASREASTDLLYNCESEGDAGLGAVEARPLIDDVTDSGSEQRRKGRERRQPQQDQHQQQRPTPQQTLNRDGSSNEGEEDDGSGDTELEESAEPALAGSSVHHLGFYPEFGHAAAVAGARAAADQVEHPYNRFDERLSQPLQEPYGSSAYAALQLHQLHHAYGYQPLWTQLMYGGPPIDGTFDAEGGREEEPLIATEAEGEREADEAEMSAQQAGSGPGSGSSIDPLDPLALGAGILGLMGIGGLGSLAYDGGGLLPSMALGQPVILLGPSLLWPVASIYGMMAAAPLGSLSDYCDSGELQGATVAGPYGVVPKLPDRPPAISSLSPRQRSVLTGRSHLQRTDAVKQRHK